ncbi:MAG: hypothetical protein H2067_02760 [Alcanivorax sp.]|nr:hypothetical protein [Alcanivorax sp.]
MSHSSFHFRFFSRWMVLGLTLYLAGFYLAPSSKAQYLTLYIGLILPTLYFTFCAFREHYLTDEKVLLWLLIALIALYLPSLWADSGSLLDTLRKNLKAVLFVLSLAMAIRHLSLYYPLLIQRLPDLLLWCGALALALFFMIFFHDGFRPNGNSGMGNLGDNPNETGLAFSVTLLLVLYRYGEDRNHYWWLLIVPLLAAIYLAYSRAAMLGLAVVVPFAILWRLGLNRTARYFLLGCLAGCVIVIALMATGHLDADSLLSRRPTLWQAFLDKNPHFSWLWGAGLADSITITPEELGQKLEPHSLFFSLILRGGLLALALFAALITLAATKARCRKAGTDTIWLLILFFGLITQFFEGVYPVRPPNSFWLYTWVPLLFLILTTTQPKATR